jgi:hypothetical protein
MAFLLRQRGWLPLHASGVSIGGIAADASQPCLLFLGIAGSGKSTTAAAFHRKGHVVITDDVGPVKISGNGDCVIQPAWSYVRLKSEATPVLGNSDSLTCSLQGDKYRYDLNTGPLCDLYSVRCAYVLEYGQDSEDARVEPVPPMEAVTLLSRHSFVRHRYMAREALERHVRDCVSVAGSIPVRRLIRPRSLAALPGLVAVVEADMGLRQPEALQPASQAASLIH